MRSFFFLFRQGIRNIFKHIGSSLFSLCVMVATILIFVSAYIVMANINHFVKDAEENVGITVFFNKGLTEEEIKAIGAEIARNEEVVRMKYTSAEQAWENYKSIYFAGNEELAEGFVDRNPLADSASYEIFINDLSRQQSFARFLETIPGIRRVNSSSVVAEGLSGLARVISVGSAGLGILLLAVAITLISNSVAVTISMRSDEIRIQRYLGAGNGFIRTPFIVEGIVIGLLGALIPLLTAYFVYPKLVDAVRSQLIGFSNIFGFLPLSDILRVIVPVSLLLGIGIGLLGSILSMKRHLRA